MDLKSNLVPLSDHVFDRTHSRLAGLTDQEYFWEPVADCWSVRVGSDGTATVDSGPDSESAPVTTIAWRLWHLVTCYGDARNELWLRGTDDGGGEVRCAPRADAAAAIEALEVAHAWWKDLLASLSDDELAAPLGPTAGPYAEASRAGFALHQIDEMIHHGAEVALLRDLFAASYG